MDIGKTLSEFWAAIMRQKGMLGLSGASMAGLLVINAALFGPLLYKFAVIIMFGAVGYYIDRAAAHYARPHKFADRVEKLANSLTAETPTSTLGGSGGSYAAKEAKMMAYVSMLNAAMVRRAVIMGSAMIAGAMAV